MTRIAPLHEVDVVRATLNLLDKQIIEITGSDEQPSAPMIDVMGDELRRLAGEVHTVSVEDEIEDRLAGSKNGDENDDPSDLLVGVDVQDPAGVADTPTGSKAG